MRYVYIDLGCYDGDSIRQFYNNPQLVVPYTEFDIYAFDPNNRFGKIWGSMESENKRLHFYNKAAYTYDGEIEYTLRPEDSPLGSTIMKTKRDWGQGEVLTVPCFDFSKWLDRFDNDDYVILKMDTEGAEYDILRKMLLDGADTKISELLIEWHDTKMSSDNTELQIDIINNLHCKVIPW